MTRTKMRAPGGGGKKPVNRKGKKGSKKAAKDIAKPFPFEKLLPELRNRVYRLALISPSPINITAGEGQPALLQVSKQIRQEASSIYFSENEFVLPLDGHDSTLGWKWCNLARPYLQNGSMAHISWRRYFGDETWDDLLVFLQRTHAGEVPRYSPDEPDDYCNEILAVEMFDDLEEELMDVPWEEAAEQLRANKLDMQRREGLTFPIFDNPGSDDDF